MSDVQEFVVNSDEIDWSEGPTGLKRKDLVDLPKGPHARVVKIEPGQIVPRHRHPCNEILYVLDGDLEMNGESYAAGTCYYKPDGWAYGPLSSQGGTTLLLFFDGNDAFQL